MVETAAPGLSFQQHFVYKASHVALDNLWTQYLSLLDLYQGLRQKLSRNLARGHLDLAKANFSNPHRVRYGKDFYDERMQASTRVFCKPENRFTLINSLIDDKKASTQGSELNPGNNVSGNPALTKEDSIGKIVEDKKLEVEPVEKDPLIWFGVLAPSTLRNSQSAFKDAVEVAARLAALDTEMKAMEIEIRRMRKKLNKVG